jgi:hypothetical protein
MTLKEFEKWIKEEMKSCRDLERASAKIKKYTYADMYETQRLIYDNVLAKLKEVK